MAGFRLLALAVLALALSGCGGGDDPGQATPPAASPPPAPADPGPLHVHGLAVDPADGSLLVATHTGLFRVEEGDLVRVGETFQDLMGFTVVGPASILASGHPDPEAAQAEGIPPNLGLIRSRDGGLSWEGVSLLGEADFHVLRAYGERVYGFDATNGRLLASGDGGVTWDERSSPGYLADLVADPDDPERLVAAGERGIARSTDAGRSWDELAPRVGLLAWPEGGPLYLVDGDGLVHVSDDGEEWEQVGETGAQPAAFHAAGARELYFAGHDGAIVRSDDGGRTWAPVASA